MTVGIYKQYLGGLHKGYIERYEKILSLNGIECIWLNASDYDFWDRVATVDLFIYQWEHYDRPKQIAKSIIPIIEYEMNISCFPDWRTSWHFDDKIKQYYLLKKHGFPAIQSYIFWDKEQALKWIETVQLPIVFKLKGGAGSSNVILIKDQSKGKRLISQMFGKGIKSGEINDRNSLNIKYFNFYRKMRRSTGNILRKIRGEYDPLYWNVDKNYVLFQNFLPNNKFDIRVSVIGNRAFAFRRYNRNNDFRASGSGIIDYNMEAIDTSALKVAFKISDKLKFQSMSYDFLYNTSKKLEIAEISYTYVDTAVFECPGYWDRNLNWHDGHYWPQFCQLMDALKKPDLKQPDLTDVK